MSDRWEVCFDVSTNNETGDMKGDSFFMCLLDDWHLLVYSCMFAEV